MSRLLDIGVDMDEVVYDFVGQLRNWLVYEHEIKREYLPNPQTWNISKEWELTRAEFEQYCHEAVDDGHLFRRGLPLDNAPYHMHRLTRLGRVHLVTARFFGTGDNSRRNTLSWLMQWQIPYDSLTFSEDKTSVPCDVFIDDRPEHVKALMDAGVQAYLRNQPWNRDTRAKRVATIGEFVDVVERISRDG